jgi:hypothetical protein
VAAIETLTITNNKFPAPELQSEPEPKEVVQVETIVVAGSGTISAPAPAPSSTRSPTGVSKYYNSDEPGCDGTDPTVLFCDDIEDGSWSKTNCDTNGGPDNSDNDGWCMGIYARWPDPQGTGYARCGTKGAAGTNCAGTSGLMKISKSGPHSSGVMGKHWFAPNNSLHDEIWVRWYQKELPGFVHGHEKVLFIQDQRGAWIVIMNKYFGSGTMPTIAKKEDRWMGQNQGSKLAMEPGNWYYMEVHIKLDDFGSSNGIYEFWMDNCGTDGLGCKGPGTLRARHTGRNFRTFAGQMISATWFENWGNPGSTGEQYYDQFYVATRRIGPM